ncbi:MAG: hypothetical protein ACI8XX_000401 [Polaribacter sp.]|jgi:hypothetical protein
MIGSDDCNRLTHLALYMNNEHDDPRRTFLVDALTLGLLGSVGSLGFMQASYALGDMPKQLPAGRSIYKLKGQVIVDGQDANIDSQITANSIVETGPNSRVIFVVGTDAFVLRSNGGLQMGGDGLLISGMRILTGKLLAVFGKRTTPHRISTSTAAIGIRGTGIYIESESDRTYLCTCYGHTQVSPLADLNVSRDIITSYHEQPVYILPTASNKKLIVSAPVFNHTDSELSLIETLVGRTTPFALAGYKVGGGGGGAY